MSEPSAPASDPTPQPEAPPIPARDEQLEKLQQEAGEWRDRCMRLQAEFENARRRLRKEADESGTRAVARALKPLLDQIDNLDRALKAARPEAFAEFAQGVSLIAEGLRGALAGCGLEPVACEGIFDPAVHEVIAEQPAPGQTKGTIVQVHRSGWRLREQLVRSAQVVVAASGETPA